MPEFDSLYSRFQHDARTLIRKHACNELFNAYVAHRQGGHSLSPSSAPAPSTLASTSLPLSSPLVRLRVAKSERVRLRIGTAMSAFDAARADEQTRRAKGNSGNSATSGVVRRHRIAQGVYLRATCRPISKLHTFLAHTACHLSKRHPFRFNSCRACVDDAQGARHASWCRIHIFHVQLTRQYQSIAKGCGNC